MKRTFPILAAFGLTLPLGADVIVQYGTANETPLMPSFVNDAVTATDLAAGAGIELNAGGTYNFKGWDVDNLSFADAVADDEKWTWGFVVDTDGIELTTMDIRLDRSGSGPDDFEIQAVVTPSGGTAGAPILCLTYDYGDSGSGVSFTDVDLSAIPALAPGDTIEFTMAAFNSESATGTFDLETITFPDGTDGITINGGMVGALPRFDVILDRTMAFENEAGDMVFLALVSRTGDTTDPLVLTVATDDPSELDVPASLEIGAGETEGLFFFDVKDDAEMDGGQSVEVSFEATGYEVATVQITVLDDDSTTSDVVLNEALINTTGTDTEFFELYNNSGATVDIREWEVVVYDSDDGETGLELASVEIPLDAAGSLDSGAFFLIGDDAFVAAFPDATPGLQVPSIGTPGGSQTLALFDAAGNLVYTVLFDDGDGEANVGGAPVTADATVGPDGSFLPAGFRFLADGGGIVEFLEFSPVPAPSATPGVTNVLPAGLVVTLSPVAVSETDGATASIGTVTRIHSDPTAALTVMLSDDDADDSEISIPASVVIPAGEGSVIFEIATLDESIMDGVQSVTITAAASGFENGTAVLSVGDDETVPPMVVINEVWADDDGGDSAEYVELFGPAGASLAGFSLIVVDGDTGGSTSASQYRKVIAQVDFTTETIPADGYFVVGGGDATPNVDYLVSLGSNGWLQNGSQTYALAPTSDIEFESGAQLSEASELDLTDSALDVVAVLDGGSGDHSYFDAPEVSGTIDLIARNGDGTDTGSPDDWNTQGNGGVELGGEGDDLSSVGTENDVVTPPVDTELVIMDTAFDTVAGELTLMIAGMDAEMGVYALEHSTDLNEADAWEIVGSVFFVGQPNVVETAPGSGIYTVTLSDAELTTESVNYYRVSEQ